MTSKLDYYEILNIAKTATEDEIKKSYKTLARKWHPDRNPGNTEEAEKMFKIVSEAYTVLSNPEKKLIYDKYGIDGLKESEQGGGGSNHHGFDGFDPMEMFKNMFGGGGGGGGDDVPDVRTTLKLKLEDCYNGKTVKHKISRHSFCNKCNGSGTKTGQNGECKKCKGQGNVMAMVGPGMMTQMPCKSCKGCGIDPSIEKCKKCNGQKFYKEEVEIDIVIPKGVYNKYPIVIEGQGNAVPPDEIEDAGKERSNVVCFVIEDPHPVFQRGLVIPEKGKVDFSDLLIELNVSFAESICGFYKEIKHISHKVQFVLKEPCRHGDVYVIKGEGMSKMKGSEFGDLFIRINVEHPKECKMSTDTKHKIAKLLHIKPVNIPTDVVPSELIPIDKYKLDAKIQSETENMKEKYKNRKHHKHVDEEDDTSDDSEQDIPQMFAGMRGMSGMPPGMANMAAGMQGMQGGMPANCPVQ
jgi:DnaJ-class molecular chaperone